MGLVLAFQSRPQTAPRSSVARRREPTTRSADILLFTGIRYERHGDAQPTGAASSERRDASLPAS